MENQNICKTCGTKKEYHEKGIKRDGSTYDAFWGCPNYRDAQHREAYDEWKKGKQGNQTAQEPKSNTGEQIIIEELNNILKSQREVWKVLMDIQTKLNE